MATRSSLSCGDTGLLDLSSSFRFFDMIPLGSFKIRIYQRQATAPGGTKYFFAPLVLLDHTSAISFRNNVTKEYEMVFGIEMWTDELQQQVADYVSNVTKETVDSNQVSVLPFDRVVINCKRCFSSDSHLAAGSYSFQHTPKRIDFVMNCRAAHHCRQLAQQMAENPKQFSQLSLHFLFDGVAVRNSNVTVTSQHVWNRQHMTHLNDNYPKTVFLLPPDRESMLKETIDNILGEADSQLNSIVDPSDQIRLVKWVENWIFDGVLHAHKPVADDPEAKEIWSQIYWNGQTPRPDTLADNLNVLHRSKYRSERRVLAELFNPYEKLDVKKVIGLSSDTLAALSTIFRIDPSQMEHFLLDARNLIEWNGSQFVPVIPTLSKIDRTRLENSFKTGKSVQIKWITPYISSDLNIQPDMSAVHFDRNPSIPTSK